MLKLHPAGESTLSRTEVRTKKLPLNASFLLGHKYVAENLKVISKPNTPEIKTCGVNMKSDDCLQNFRFRGSVDARCNHSNTMSSMTRRRQCR